MQDYLMSRFTTCTCNFTLLDARSGMIYISACKSDSLRLVYSVSYSKCVGSDLWRSNSLRSAYRIARCVAGLKLQVCVNKCALIKGAQYSKESFPNKFCASKYLFDSVDLW